MIRQRLRRMAGIESQGVEELDQWFPPCGSCWLCGHPDKRHRQWDAILRWHDSGDSRETIAWGHNVPVEAVDAVIRLRPYQPRGLLGRFLRYLRGHMVGRPERSLRV